MEKNLQRVTELLSEQLGSDHIFTRRAECLAKGTDASFYRLIPQAVVRIESEEEALKVITACKENKVPLTFKAGGTSLSGQTITNSLLVEIGDLYSKSRIEENGRLASFQCGITGGLANRRLAAFGRKLGPSPASINSANISGIVANNASGSSYGIRYNSYNTLRGIRIILPDGTLLDTRDKQSRDAFRATHAELLSQLSLLSQEVKQSEGMSKKIRHKYELKNTCGYGVNSLLDYDAPIDILEHLIVGSEGTLAFISEVSFETVASLPLKATALIFFPHIRYACEAIPALRATQVSAAELMDRKALKAVANKPGMPAVLNELPEEAVALLIDASASDEAELKKKTLEITEALKDLPTLYPFNFTLDPVEYARLWRVREGLFTSAASVRPKGTACIIEDLAFRAEVLADALVELQEMILKYGYDDYVMWGHLLDGNIHFTIMPDFSRREEMQRYELFMEELVELTLRYDGSLKAEHGTGRNMAPFVEKEWGSEIYSVMKRIKNIIDPEHILNPGALLNEDNKVHLKNIKPMPAAHELIDTCIECGFCEPSCPSKNLSLTPRQRIVLYREMQALSLTQPDDENLRELERYYNYSGDETCATDGLCALNCPVEINTGDLVKDLRFTHHGKLSRSIASAIASHMEGITSILRISLNAASMFRSLFGNKFLEVASLGLHYMSGRNIPVWNPNTPKGAPKIKPQHSIDNQKARVVYFPTCINRSMGVSPDYEEKTALVEKTMSILKKAGYEIVLPENFDKLCCGMAFDSKGFKAEGKKKALELEEALLKATENGQLPVLCDMSPCLYRMKQTLSKDLKLYEPVEFSLKFLTQKLRFQKLPIKVAIHSTCSNTKMGLEKDLRTLAELCAQEVYSPDQVGCCGWAGDRGFSRPELNASALRHLPLQLPKDITAAYSTSRTCEIGLTSQSGISYVSVLYLLDKATESINDNG